MPNRILRDGALHSAAVNAVSIEAEWLFYRLLQVADDFGLFEAEAHALKLGKVAQPLRVAIAGRAVSPPIDVTLALLGREKTLKRLDAALDYLKRPGHSA